MLAGVGRLDQERGEACALEAGDHERDEEIGQGLVMAMWVDTDKGAEGEVRVRSRLVAINFKNKGDKDREDLFAATPPLEI